MFTGKGREDVAVEALNLGADRYLHKHGDPETVYGQLAHSIKEAVRHRRMEEELRESRRKYRILLSNIPHKIFFKDLESVYVLCNDSYARDLNITPDQIKGKTDYDFFPKELADKYRADDRRIMQSGESEEFEERYIQDGEERYVHTLKAPVRDSQGEVVGILGIFWDITEQKQAEKAVRESQQKFQAMFMDSPEAAVYTDQNYRILDINPRFTELFGYKLEEVKGKPINEVVVPEDKWEEAERLNREAAQEKPARLDTVRRRKDGSLVPVSVSASRITVGGRFKGYIALYTDVSELKEKERELEESRRHFQQLFNLMVDPVAIVDGKGKFLEVTDRVEEITGFKKEELLGKNLLRTRIVTAKSKAILIKNLAKRMMGMHIAPYEIEVVTKDGRKLPYEVNAAKIEYKGQPANMVVFRDITDRKKMEEKLQVVGKLTRHDVRNKLSAVTSNVYLAKKRLADDPQGREYLENIQSAVEQATRIFDFARTYEQLGTKQLEYIDVEQMVKEAVQEFSDLPAEVKNECRGLEVMADSLLSRLFYNLIYNSLQHGGEVNQIRVYCQEADEEVEGLRLVYEDDGVGIPEDEKEKIFQEGYGKGMGYGLYLVRRMCEVYGWSIRERGRPGGGAKFIISIPHNTTRGKRGYRLD